MYIFFSFCRKSKKDELRSFRDDGTTRRIYVAESRLEPDEQRTFFFCFPTPSNTQIV